MSRSSPNGGLISRPIFEENTDLITVRCELDTARESCHQRPPSPAQSHDHGLLPAWPAQGRCAAAQSGCCLRAVSAAAAGSGRSGIARPEAPQSSKALQLGRGRDEEPARVTGQRYLEGGAVPTAANSVRTQLGEIVVLSRDECEGGGLLACGQRRERLRHRGLGRVDEVDGVRVR
jgi:hypothetical protein